MFFCYGSVLDISFYDKNTGTDWAGTSTRVGYIRTSSIKNESFGTTTKPGGHF